MYTDECTGNTAQKGVEVFSTDGEDISIINSGADLGIFKGGGSYSDSGWQPAKLRGLGACPPEKFLKFAF